MRSGWRWCVQEGRAFPAHPPDNFREYVTEGALRIFRAAVEGKVPVDEAATIAGRKRHLPGACRVRLACAGGCRPGAEHRGGGKHMLAQYLGGVRCSCRRCDHA